MPGSEERIEAQCVFIHRGAAGTTGRGLRKVAAKASAYTLYAQLQLGYMSKTPYTSFLGPLPKPSAPNQPVLESLSLSRSLEEKQQYASRSTYRPLPVPLYLSQKSWKRESVLMTSTGHTFITSWTVTTYPLPPHQPTNQTEIQTTQRQTTKVGAYKILCREAKPLYQAFRFR